MSKSIIRDSESCPEEKCCRFHFVTFTIIFHILKHLNDPAYESQRRTASDVLDLREFRGHFRIWFCLGFYELWNLVMLYGFEQMNLQLFVLQDAV